MQTLANTPPASQHSSTEARPRPLIRVKDIAWLVYLYPARWLARVLPLRWLYALADAAAVCGSACLRRPRKAILAQLAPAFHSSTADPRLRALAGQWLRNAILRFFDDLLLADRFRDLPWRDVELVNVENLEQALAAGHGAILVGGHHYANRVAKRYLATIGFPSLSVRNHRPPDQWAGRLGMRLLQKRYEAFLGRALGEDLDVRDPDCSLQMLARLRAGGLVYVLFDKAASREQVRHVFFGQERLFSAGFLYVAKLAGCPLVPLHCLGNSRRLRIEFGKALWLENAPDRRSFAATNLREVLRMLEEQIARHPADYEMWLRW